MGACTYVWVWVCIQERVCVCVCVCVCVRKRSLHNESNEEIREDRAPPILAMFGTGTGGQVYVKRGEGFSLQIELSL